MTSFAMAGSIAAKSCLNCFNLLKSSSPFDKPDFLFKNNLDVASKSSSLKVSLPSLISKPDSSFNANFNDST